MMRTAQLIPVAVTLALMTTACTRAETEQQTQRAAAEVKTAAARAGETLADGWLTTRIQAQYFADDQVKARYIDVKTDDGVVTIKGFVESPAARERALQIARATPGVKQVKDEILIGQSPRVFETQQPVATTGTVSPGGGATLPPSGGATPSSGGVAVPADDADVASRIQAVFFLDPTVKSRQIEVAARSGVVTLRGEVASEAERSQALMLARSVAGVQRVEDSLAVNAALEQSTAPASQSSAPPAAAPLDDATIAADVKAKLAADQQLRAVEATARGGVIELTGTVPSAAARQRAVDLVRDANGVAQVVDRLTIKR